jgi:hypothetical protein
MLASSFLDGTSCYIQSLTPATGEEPLFICSPPFIRRLSNDSGYHLPRKADGKDTEQFAIVVADDQHAPKTKGAFSS